jgi:hypothetical protein
MTTGTIDRRTAPDLAEEEDRRFGDLLHSLTAEEWHTPTELPGWDVRAIALHVLGEAESHRITELVHQLVAGRKAAKGRALVDGINDVQIADRAHLGPDEILARLDAAEQLIWVIHLSESNPFETIVVTWRLGSLHLHVRRHHHLRHRQPPIHADRSRHQTKGRTADPHTLGVFASQRNTVTRLHDG